MSKVTTSTAALEKICGWSIPQEDENKDLVIEWGEETQQKNAELQGAQIRDAVKKFMGKDYLLHHVAEIEAMAAKKIENRVQFIENACKFFGVSRQANTVQNYFMDQGSNSTVFDAVQALTYFAQHNADPETRFNIEMGVTDILSHVEKFDIAEISEN